MFPLLNMMVHLLTAYSLGMEAHVLTIGLLILFILFNFYYYLVHCIMYVKYWEIILLDNYLLVVILQYMHAMEAPWSPS